MKKKSQLNSLLKELGRDPQLKRIIAKVRRQTRRKNTAGIENFTDIVFLGLAMTSRFLSKKKARGLEDLMDVLYPLIQISVLLKENIFDRPEVKEFFSQQSKQMSSLVQGFVTRLLERTHFPNQNDSPRASK